MSNKPLEETPRQIDFDESERKYLSGLCAMLYKMADKQEMKAVWGWEATKIKTPAQSYTVSEVELLSRAVNTIITRTDLVLQSISEEDVEGRVKAQALLAAYKSIRSKLDGK